MRKYPIKKGIFNEKFRFSWLRSRTLAVPAAQGIVAYRCGTTSHIDQERPMALWKEPTKQSPSPGFPPDPVTPARFEVPPGPETKPEAATPVAAAAPVRTQTRAAEKSESLIAPDIAIEGKIEGAGHVRVAGRFKGDINVHGDLTIDPRANVTGSVRAEKVIIAGELVGNIDAAAHVELTQSGALTGDLKAGTLTVAAGSRMRGHAEFGWGDEKSSTHKPTNGSAS